jgi:hypothetical protein
LKETINHIYSFEMASRIPTSTSVTESAVIQAPLSSVWHLIKLQDFHHFWSKLDQSQHAKGTSPETDVVKWTFKDGTVQEIKQEEHSVCLVDALSNTRLTAQRQLTTTLPIVSSLQRQH